MIIAACGVLAEQLEQETNIELKEHLKRLYYVPKVTLTVQKGRVQFN